MLQESKRSVENIGNKKKQKDFPFRMIDNSHRGEYNICGKS
jgi:hypothetical protein